MSENISRNGGVKTCSPWNQRNTKDCQSYLEIEMSIRCFTSLILGNLEALAGEHGCACALERPKKALTLNSSNSGEPLGSGKLKLKLRPHWKLPTAVSKTGPQHRAPQWLWCHLPFAVIVMKCMYITRVPVQQRFMIIDVVLHQIGNKGVRKIQAYCLFSV